MRIGAVAHQKDEHVRVIQQADVPTDNMTEKLMRLGTDMTLLIDTISPNLMITGQTVVINEHSILRDFKEINELQIDDYLRVSGPSAGLMYWFMRLVMYREMCYWQTD